MAGVRVGRPPNPLPVEEAIELYENGMGMREIAGKFHVQQTRVKALLERSGVQIRPLVGWGEAHPRWRGGRTITRQGYVKITVAFDDPIRSLLKLDRGGIWEHRYVMTKILGRSLTPDETVHHIDGNRQNNHPNNLQLRRGSHGEGMVHRCNNCGSYDIQAVEL